MDLFLVSSTTENLPDVDLSQRLNDITVYKTTSLEYFLGKNTCFDLVVFDARLGLKTVTQQIHLCQQNNLHIKWLVINASDIQQSLQYLKMGTSGILTQLDEETLRSCLQSISDNRLYLESDFIQILALRQIKKMLLPFKQLTAREYDVFCLLAENYSIQMIAGQLSITTKTAFNCQSQLRKKLDVKTQQDIFLLAKKHGLVN